MSNTTQDSVQKLLRLYMTELTFLLFLKIRGAT